METPQYYGEYHPYAYTPPMWTNDFPTYQMPSLSAEDVGRFVSHTSSPDLHGPRGSASASLPAYYFSHDHTSTTPPLYQQPFHLSPPTLMPPPSTEYLDYDEMPVRTYHSNDFSPVPDSVPPSYSASQSYSTHTPPPEARTSSFPITDYIKRGRGRDAPAMVGGPYDEVSTERCFICQIPGCARGFLRLEHLRRHVRSIHTDDKPHVCPEPTCGMAFNRSDNLRQHFRTHTRTTKLSESPTS